MTATELKLIAIAAMLIDHIGAILFPNVQTLRIIGRVAFPIFAYFIAEGYLKTRNVKKYLLRLFIFALIAQGPFYLAFGQMYYLNIFFTLFLGLCAIIEYDKDENISPVILIGILAQILNTDYGIYGILTIYIFYRYHDDFKSMVKNQIFLNLIFSVSIFILGIIGYSADGKAMPEALRLSVQAFFQSISILSLLLIKYYNGERGRNIKYLFYGFYPAHLLILWWIKSL